MDILESRNIISKTEPVDLEEYRNFGRTIAPKNQLIQCEIVKDEFERNKIKKTGSKNLSISSKPDFKITDIRSDCLNEEILNTDIVNNLDPKLLKCEVAYVKRMSKGCIGLLPVFQGRIESGQSNEYKSQNQLPSATNACIKLPSLPSGVSVKIIKSPIYSSKSTDIVSSDLSVEVNKSSNMEVNKSSNMEEMSSKLTASMHTSHSSGSLLKTCLKKDHHAPTSSPLPSTASTYQTQTINQDETPSPPSSPDYGTPSNEQCNLPISPSLESSNLINKPVFPSIYLSSHNYARPESYHSKPHSSIWDNDRTKHFLSLRSKHDDLFQDNKTKKKDVWKKMAGEMESEGYLFTGEQLENKWKNMIKQYKKADHNRQNGTYPMTCSYHKELDEILGYRHNISPAVLSSNLIGEISSDEELRSPVRKRPRRVPEKNLALQKCATSLAENTAAIKALLEHQQQRDRKRDEYQQKLLSLFEKMIEKM